MGCCWRTIFTSVRLVARQSRAHAGERCSSMSPKGQNVDKRLKIYEEEKNRSARTSLLAREYLYRLITAHSTNHASEWRWVSVRSRLLYIWVSHHHTHFATRCLKSLNSDSVCVIRCQGELAQGITGNQTLYTCDALYSSTFFFVVIANPMLFIRVSLIRIRTR